MDCLIPKVRQKKASYFQFPVTFGSAFAVGDHPKGTSYPFLAWLSFGDAFAIGDHPFLAKLPFGDGVRRASPTAKGVILASLSYGESKDSEAKKGNKSDRKSKIRRTEDA